jgi:hypothetical protein
MPSNSVKLIVRTGLNLIIVVLDVVPGVGELFSWSADGWKVLVRLAGRVDLDLTPDVPVWTALSTEALELVSPVIPTHIIEALLQLRADWPRIKQLWRRS